VAAKPATKVPKQVLVTNLTEARPNIGIRYEITQLLDDCERASVDPGTVFKAGDRVRFSLESNTDGYLYIINRGTSGKWKYIFPHPMINSGNNSIQKGQKYTIPPQNWLQFDKNPGQEEIFIVLSRSKVDPFESGVLKQGQAPAEQPIADAVIDELNSHVKTRALVFEKEESVTKVASFTKPQVQNTYAVNPEPDSYFVTKVVLQHVP